jgi:hypothetical protein
MKLNELKLHNSGEKESQNLRWKYLSTRCKGIRLNCKMILCRYFPDQISLWSCNSCIDGIFRYQTALPENETRSRFIDYSTWGVERKLSILFAVWCTQTKYVGIRQLYAKGVLRKRQTLTWINRAINFQSFIDPLNNTGSTSQVETLFLTIFFHQKTTLN